jgi:hypothetical protein
MVHQGGGDVLVQLHHEVLDLCVPMTSHGATGDVIMGGSNFDTGRFEGLNGYDSTKIDAGRVTNGRESANFKMFFLHFVKSLTARKTTFVFLFLFSNSTRQQFWVGLESLLSSRIVSAAQLL